ncbi:lipoyltransferase 1 isoform X2 [Lycorma delicatula]|uniref:lipoyltransferase 1 isoform X2 n=1 Tax=Lycorma delicatula TaxID=130591 RepID=UPI003F512A7B
MSGFVFHSLKVNYSLLFKCKNSHLVHALKQPYLLRHFSEISISKNKTGNEVTNNESEIVKSVYISQSTDIFTNLALEDWIYKNFDFSKQHIMLLWKNSPCVVIGRHQNPWLEANLAPMSQCDIEIARRNSGGGTVYHDNGNLNLSFFTPREHYNRRRNLELIGAALNREWKIKTEINKREDLLVDGKYKISGTASKLGRPNAYHHCTLLVNVNQIHLRQVLSKDSKGIETNATRSTPAPVKNLNETDSSVTVDRLVNAVGWEFLRRTPLTLTDGGWDLVQKQNGFQLVNPTDEWFPGLEKIRSEFESWNWRFGRTPKFSVTRTFPLPENIRIKGEEELTVKVEVENGLVQDVIFHIPASLMMSEGLVDDIQVMTSIRGRKFTEDALEELNHVLGETQDLKTVGKEFVVDCMRKVMASV